MNVADIPFNGFLGLQKGESGLTLPDDPKYLNHLGTVHASAQFALAEASSGEWLVSNFGDAVKDNLAVVRHVDLKYRRPSAGQLSARAEVPAEEADVFRETLERRGRASLAIAVQVVAADGQVTLEATFEWFAQRIHRA